MGKLNCGIDLMKKCIWGLIGWTCVNWMTILTIFSYRKQEMVNLSPYRPGKRRRSCGEMSFHFRKPGFFGSCCRLLSVRESGPAERLSHFRGQPENDEEFAGWSEMSTVYVLEPPTKGKVVLNTTHGPLDIELWPKEAPKAVRNFVQLCLEGYFENTIFHRIIKEFLVQGGDPTGSGTGLYSFSTSLCKIQWWQVNCWIWTVGTYSLPTSLW